MATRGFNPGGPLPVGGQPGMHPTVSYGLPGAPPAMVLPHNAPMPADDAFTGGGPMRGPAPVAGGPQFFGAGYDPRFMPPAPTPGVPQYAAAPAPVPGAPPAAPAYPPGFAAWAPPAAPTPAAPQNYGFWAQPPAAPQYAPAPAPAPAPAVPAGAYIPPNAILDGPNVPPELRGKTWGQIAGIYNGLATAWARTGGFQRLGGGDGGHPAPAPQAAPAGPGGPAPQPRSGFWEDARNIIREEIQTATAPMATSFYSQSIEGAKQRAAQLVSDFGVLEADLVHDMSNMPPQVLSNPQSWISAADLARGRMIREGRYNPQAAPQARPMPQAGGGWGWNNQPPQAPAPRAVPAGYTPVPQYSFFSEQPTPWTGPGGGASGSLTGPEQWAANLMGMDPATYSAWKGGIQSR